ncbi:MAG: FkbM family methyltransferase [Planctomycetes bacterium]|nr:FkbM family methyltransferase [Planctomycetota bacterium]
MSSVPITVAVDQVATRDPERFGFGYADTQHPWHCDPAIDLPRALAQQLAMRLRRSHERPVVLLAGLCGRGALHHLVRCFAQRTITVDGDGPAMTALAETLEPGSGADVLIPYRHDDGAARHDLQRFAGEVDALVLDGLQDREDARRAWPLLAARVRVGGVVVIIDRSQVFEGSDSPGVDRFVQELVDEVLMPHGVQPERLGRACCAHVYTQTAPLRDAARAGCGGAASRASVPVIERGGFLIHAHGRGAIAVPGAEGAFSAARLANNGFSVVLVGDDAADAAAAIDAWRRLDAHVPDVMAALERHQSAAALATIAALRREHPDLLARITAAVEAAPWCRRLLIAAGLLSLTDAPRQGVALLSRALRTDVFDGRLLQAVAAACLEVLGDQDEARALLAECRMQVRRREVAQLCHERLGHSVLRHFPHLLCEVKGVVHVGAHRGEALVDWGALRIPHLCLIEGNPEVLPVLRQAAAAAGPVVVIEAVVDEHPGRGTLRLGADSAGGSLLEHHALAAVPDARRQTRALPVDLTTLDALVQRGAVDASRCDLLVIDTEGNELPVLRGAVGLLHHVELICVSVCLAPLYVGAPLPQKLQGFLRDVLGDDGFSMVAFDPSADGARGQALFRRIKGRES